MLDPLSDVIALLRPSTVFSKGISGAGRWAVRYTAFGHPSFCTILEGSCRLDVDGQPPVTLEAGDFLLAKAEGLIHDEHIVGEIGEILAGRVAGRASPDEITLFESLGLGVEDVAAAHHVCTRAHAERQGTRVSLGARRQ